jgi:hypothetical protein
MASTQQYRRFLAWTASVAGAGALACVVLVLLVDPYRLYRLVERPGINQVKTQPERYQKEIKLSGAQATRADLFIVGNSRAEIGLDPDYPALSDAGLRPYNLALAGTRIQVAREQLEQLGAAGQHARRLIVGAEFLDFPIDPEARQLPAPPTVLPSLPGSLAWRFDALFSIDSVADAVKTLRSQHNPDAARMSARGFNPLSEYKQLAREEGYYALFHQRAQDYAARFAKAPRSLVTRASGSAREFDQLQAVLALGVRDGAAIDVVIYPYHAQIMALFEQTGLAPLFEQWKTLLAAQVDALRAAHPQARITLWDFSGYAPYQCEAIPAKGDRQAQTRWYWEAGHFKAELGNIMLARMLGNAADGSFGYRLTPAGIDANRQRVARERATCLAAYPALFNDAAALAQAGRP